MAVPTENDKNRARELYGELWSSAATTEQAVEDIRDIAQALADTRAEERERLFEIREQRKCEHLEPHAYWLNLRDDFLDNEMGPFNSKDEALAALKGNK